MLCSPTLIPGLVATGIIRFCAQSAIVLPQPEAGQLPHRYEPMAHTKARLSDRLMISAQRCLRAMTRPVVRQRLLGTHSARDSSPIWQPRCR